MQPFVPAACYLPFSLSHIRAPLACLLWGSSIGSWWLCLKRAAVYWQLGSCTIPSLLTANLLAGTASEYLSAGLGSSVSHHTYSFGLNIKGTGGCTPLSAVRYRSRRHPPLLDILQRQTRFHFGTSAGRRSHHTPGSLRPNRATTYPSETSIPLVARAAEHK